MRPKSPCQDCPDRSQWCHSNCEKYSSYCESCEEFRKKNHEETQKIVACYDSRKRVQRIYFRKKRS